MSSLLTQLREAKSGLQREQGKSTAFVKSYNTFLSKTYNPAFQKAKDYFPKVNKSYQQYREAYDAASSSFTREKQQLYNVYEGERQKGAGLKSTFEQQQAGLQKVYREQYQPVRQEYDRRLGAYNTAYDKAVKGAEGQYTQQANQLLRNLNVAQDNRRRDYGSTKAFRTSSYERSYNSALEALTKFNKMYKGDIYYQNEQGIGNTVYNPMKDEIQRHDSVEYLGGSQFKYNIKGEEYNIKQAPSSYDVSLKFQIQKKVKDFNFYRQVIQEGNRDLVGIPSYVDKNWLQQEGKRLNDWLTPNTGLVDIINRLGESRRKTIAEKYEPVQELISQKDIAEKSLRDFVSVSQADYVLSKTGKERKAYQDFTATSLEDFAKPIATEASKRQYTEMQQYIPTLNQASNIYNEYHNKNYQPAYQAYQNFLNTGAVSSSLSQYQNFVNNQGSYFSSRVGASQSTYEDTKSTYEGLQATYKGYEPQLEQLRTKAETSSEAYLGFKADEARLEKSVRLELDPRKRGTRVGSRRSLITSGSKRASSAR